MFVAMICCKNCPTSAPRLFTFWIATLDTPSHREMFCMKKSVVSSMVLTNTSTPLSCDARATFEIQKYKSSKISRFCVPTWTYTATEVLLKLPSLLMTHCSNKNAATNMAVQKRNNPNGPLCPRMHMARTAWKNWKMPITHELKQCSFKICFHHNLPEQKQLFLDTRLSLIEIQTVLHGPTHHWTMHFTTSSFEHQNQSTRSHVWRFPFAKPSKHGLLMFVIIQNKKFRFQSFPWFTRKNCSTNTPQPHCQTWILELQNRQNKKHQKTASNNVPDRSTKWLRSGTCQHTQHDCVSKFAPWW